MQLVEVVHSDAPMRSRGTRRRFRTSDRSPAPAGQEPPGFLVNRVLLPYLLEAVTAVTRACVPSSSTRRPWTSACRWVRSNSPIPSAWISVSRWRISCRRFSACRCRIVCAAWSRRDSSAVRADQGFYVSQGQAGQGQAVTRTRPHRADLIDRLILACSMRQWPVCANAWSKTPIPRRRHRFRHGFCAVPRRPAALCAHLRCLQHQGAPADPEPQPRRPFRAR